MFMLNKVFESESESDDDNLSELSSLTHLLDNDDGNNDTNDTHTIINSLYSHITV